MQSEIVKLLRSRGIFCKTEGVNVKRGWVNIKCPFCGTSDPDYHLNINPWTGKYFCWRNKSHRGNFSYLWQYLTGLKFSAEGIIWQELDKTEVRAKYLEFPASFKHIKNDYFGKRFLRYLESRGFDNPLKVVEKYRLRYSLVEQWAYRIIFPLYYQNRLMTWVGRSIGNIKKKYLELKGEDSVRPPKEMLFNYDNLCHGGKFLFITEGVMDAMKLDFYNKNPLIQATCLFGLRLKSEKQEVLLGRLANVFDMFVILLDKEALNASYRLYSEMRAIKKRVMVTRLNDVNDPGEMDEGQVKNFIDDFLKRSK